MSHQDMSNKNVINYVPEVDIYVFYTTGFDSYKEFEVSGIQNNDEQYVELYDWVHSWVDDSIRKKCTHIMKNNQCQNDYYIPTEEQYKEFFNVVDSIADSMLELCQHIAKKYMSTKNKEKRIIDTNYSIYDKAFNVNTGSVMLNQIIRDTICSSNNINYLYASEFAKQLCIHDIKNRIDILLNIADEIYANIQKDNI